MKLKLACKRCDEKVMSKGFCKLCRLPICLNRFGWYHDGTGYFTAIEPKFHVAIPGGRNPKRRKESRVRVVAAP